MNNVTRRALSSQKRRGNYHAANRGKKQRIEDCLTDKIAVQQDPHQECLRVSPQRKDSLEVPKPADWDDDSIYDGLDIDSLIEISQQSYKISQNFESDEKCSNKAVKEDCVKKQTDFNTSQVLDRTDLIVTGSPELFGDDSNIISELPEIGMTGGCVAKRNVTDSGKVTGMHPVAASTQKEAVHSTRVQTTKSNQFVSNSAKFNQEIEAATDLEAEIWFQEIQENGNSGNQSNQISESGLTKKIGQSRTSAITSANPRNKASVGKMQDPSILETKSLPSQNAEGLNLSLGSRLKQKLQKNARAVTPVGQRRKCSAARRASINKALQEIETVEKNDGSVERDIGPFYGLPTRVQELLTLHRGITQLYDWQHTCLTLPSVKSGQNLIYSLPTSGGKTLVAEILILQQLLCHKKDAILILPYVSIVQEKVSSLSVLAIELGFLVEEYAGTKGAIPPRKRRKKNTLFVCTIEKAHSLVNSLIVEKRIDSIALVVVDELHMLGDGSRRGACLESTLSKLKHLGLSQIIGMSATLSNIQDLCRYLDAEIYTSQFRPVELTEYIKVGDGIYQINTGALCPDDRFSHSRNVAFPYNSTMKKNDPDHLLGLALEVIPYNSCLIFCATKKNCQSVAQLICKYMPRNVSKTILAHKKQGKEELLLALKRECDDHICSTLRRTVPYGVAYHHSGLTMDERKLIEEAYNDGALCLLACTSTLAAGVNLPAKRVILRSPYIARDLLTCSRYKQMVGRAGRAGLDSSGESILILQERDRQAVADMLNSPLEGCHSSLLHDDGKGIRSLILSLVALQLTNSREEVHTFMSKTLLGVQSRAGQRDVPLLTDDTLEQLVNQQLMKVRQNEDPMKCTYEVTNLGKAAFKGAIDIDQCSQLYSDLQEVCAQGMVLANTLHLLYLVTPYEQTETVSPNWLIFDRQFSTLGEAEMKVAELIGITEHFIKSKVTGNSSKKFTDHSERQASRFYLALMLWNILNRKSIWHVSERFEVSRGFVQGLFTSSASFASSIQRFCEDLPQFWAIHQLLSKVTYDLSYCATADLLPLLEVSGVKQGRARQLVNAGYKTLRHLAFADADTLVKEIEHLPKRVAKEIISAAKLQLAERAEALREEAEDMMTLPTPLAPPPPR